LLTGAIFAGSLLNSSFILFTYQLLHPSNFLLSFCLAPDDAPPTAH